MKKISKIKIIFTILGIAIFSSVFLFGNTARAQSNSYLEVIWSNDTSPFTLFTVDNFLPGDIANTKKWFKVSNTNPDLTADPEPIGFFVTVTERSNLLDVLKVNIIDDSGANEIYSSTFASIEGKLEHGDYGDFIGTGFNTGINNYLTLATLQSGAEKQFFLSVDFDSTAGNEYRDKSVEVDFIVGFLGSPPPPEGPGIDKVSIDYAYPSGKVVGKIVDETILLKNIGDTDLDAGILTATLPIDYLLPVFATPVWESYNLDTGEVKWTILELPVDETYLIKFSVKPIKSGTGIVSSVNYKSNTELTVYGEENIGRVAGVAAAAAEPSEETIPQALGRILGAAITKTGGSIAFVLLLSFLIASICYLIYLKERSKKNKENCDI